MSFSQKLAEHLPSRYKQDLSLEDQIEVIEYGNAVNLDRLKLLLALSFLSLILGIFKPTMIMFSTFYMLRRCFGGFHFENEVKCFITTVSLALLLGYVTTKINFDILIFIGVFIFGVITLNIKGTIDNPNKRFEDGNKRLNLALKEKFYKQGILTFLLIALANTIIYLNGWALTSNAITIGVFAAFFNLYFQPK